MGTDGIKWRDELPAETQQQREVFARFGLAGYQAQCVERQLAILLATTHNRSFLRSSPEERDAFFDSEFAKTLGRLVSSLEEKATIPADFETRVRRGVGMRNWLIHHYFWERAGSILTWDGREQMIRELQDAADFLDALDAELTAISNEWLASVGISKEAVEAGLAKYRLGYDA